jgi:hypothetical protein
MTQDALAVLLGIMGDKRNSLAVNPYANLRGVFPVFFMKKMAILLLRFVLKKALAAVEAKTISQGTLRPKHASPVSNGINLRMTQTKKPLRVITVMS